MNTDLTKLPPPPKGQKGFTIDELSSLPPPPKGQQGFTLDQLQPKKTKMNAYENLGNNANEFAAGFVKGAARGTVDVAAGLQKFGQKALSIIPGVSKSAVDQTGFKSLKDTTVEGKGVQDILKADNTAQKLGGYAETALELGVAGVKAIPAARKGFRILAEKIFTGKALTEEERLIQSTLDIVRPTLNKIEKEGAIAAGRGETKGILKKTVIRPSQRELEIADTVKEIVDPTNDIITNVKNVRGEIARVGQEVETGLKQVKIPVNNSEFKSYINQAKSESEVLFGGDKALESSYDAVAAEMERQLAKQEQTLDGVLAARKEFDKVIEKKFPNLLSGQAGDNIKRNAVLDIRRQANDFIADHLPDGHPFKDLLRKQSLMYEAVDNMAVNGAKQVGTSVVSRTAKKVLKNPLVQGVVGGGVTAAGLKLLGD